MLLSDFDRYDQAQLVAAWKSGRRFARVAESTEGPWVTAVSVDDLSEEIERVEFRRTIVVRLERIEGLSSHKAYPAARGPAAAVTANAGEATCDTLAVFS